MSLWLVTRTDYVDREEVQAMVIRAKNEKEVVAMVTTPNEQSYQKQRFYGFELDGSNMRVTLIPATGLNEIILESNRLD